MGIGCEWRGMCWEVIVEVWPPGRYVDVVDSCVDGGKFVLNRRYTNNELFVPVSY